MRNWPADGHVSPALAQNPCTGVRAGDTHSLALDCLALFTASLPLVTISILTISPCVYIIILCFFNELSSELRQEKNNEVLLKAYYSPIEFVNDNSISLKT